MFHNMHTKSTVCESLAHGNMLRMVQVAEPGAVIVDASTRERLVRDSAQQYPCDSIASVRHL
jgi:hypothetical protein